MWRLVVLIVVCVGCGRIGFDLTSASDAAMDGDASSDGASGDGDLDGSLDEDGGDGSRDGAGDDDDGGDDDDDDSSDAGDGGDGAPADAPSCRTPCEPVAPQCGCTAGSGCYLPANGDPLLCASSSGQARGTACMADADCAPGLACNIFRSSLQGVCEAYCRDDSTCGGTLCSAIVIDGIAGGCATNCDPRLLTGCPGALACRIETIYRHPSMELRLIAACEPPDGLGEDADCPMTSSCAAGLACLNFKCVPICRVGRSDCTTGTCTGFEVAGGVGPLFYDGERLGACLR